MVDPKPALLRNRLGQRRDGVLIELFDVAAGCADQVVVMTRLTPDVG
jgi:hypothetical protein